MRVNILSICLLFIVLCSCEKQEKESDNPHTLISDFKDLSAYRGDTISFEVSKVNLENLVVVFYAYNRKKSDTLKKDSYFIKDDKLAIVIPKELLYVQEVINWDLLELGQVKCLLDIYENDNSIYSGSFSLLFNPTVDKIIINDKISANETVEFFGRDLDINNISAVFNTLESEIVEQTTNYLKVTVPDSCGHGILSLSHKESKENHIFFEHKYSYNFINQIHKNPIKRTIRYPKNSISTTLFEFNSDNRISVLESYGQIFYTVGNYKKKFYYNNFQQLTHVDVFFENELVKVDSITYTRDSIVEHNYKVKGHAHSYEYPDDADSLFLYHKAYYYLNDTGRIIKRKNYFVKYKNNIMTITFDQLLEYNFISTNQCELVSTIEIDSGEMKSYYKYIDYNNYNPQIPLQLFVLEYYNRGKMNYLDRLFFPGSVIESSVPHQYIKDINLYYDQFGNIAREEYEVTDNWGSDVTKTYVFWDYE